MNGPGNTFATPDRGSQEELIMMKPLHIYGGAAHCCSFIILNLCMIAYIIISGASPVSAAADAWLDTNSISMGESVQLTVKTDSKFKGTPDTTPLEKDFIIMGSSSSSSVSIVNGSISSSTTWFYQLSPRKNGKLRIPPVKVGKEYTPELFVEVTGHRIPDADSGQDIFIETSCTPHDPFVQQQVSCTVKLFSARDITEGSMSAPGPRNAVVRQIGKDRDYHSTRNSRNYRIIERRYVLFPQESGEITISPPVFSGAVVTKSRAGDPFSSFMGRDPFFNRRLPGFTQNTRHVRISGKTITLKVKPRPAEDRGRYWLPATSVRLSEKWEPDTTEIHEGDPVTRTLTITAQGLTGEQLPEITPASVPGVKIYPDKAAVTTKDNGNGVIGKRTRKIAFIPEKPGTAMLPSVELRWWNIKSGKPESISLPGRKITVLPTTGTERLHKSEPAPEIPGRTTAIDQHIRANPGEKARTSITTLRKSAHAHPWQWLAAGLGLAWLITLYLLWQERRKHRHTDGIRPYSGRKDGRGKPDIYKKRFRAACMTNDAGEARSELLKWAATVWPENPPAGLWELSERIPDTEAAEELRRLEKLLYSKTPGKWENGHRLASLLRKLPESNRHDGHGTVKTSLPPLYHTGQGL